MNRTLLTISGLDGCGATGVAADLKTFQTFRTYGVAAISAVLVRNTLGVQALHPIPMEILGQEIEALATDLSIHGVKVGLLPDTAHIQMVATLLEAFKLRDRVVVDTTIWAGPGVRVLDDSGVAALKEKLLPGCYLVVANGAEAEALTGIAVKDASGARDAAKALADLGARSVVVSGGDLEGNRVLDVWYDGARHHVFDAPRLATRNTLGLGDTFSAILATYAVKGVGVGESVEKAKQYIAKAMQHPFQIGKGPGPLNHTLPM